MARRMSGIDAVVFDLGNVLIAVDERRAAEQFAQRTGKTAEEVEAYFRSTPYATELALGKQDAAAVFAGRWRGTWVLPAATRSSRRFWNDMFAPIEPMNRVGEESGATPATVDPVEHKTSSTRNSSASITRGSMSSTL